MPWQLQKTEKKRRGTVQGGTEEEEEEKRYFLSIFSWNKLLKRNHHVWKIFKIVKRLQNIYEMFVEMSCLIKREIEFVYCNEPGVYKRAFDCHRELFLLKMG